MGNGVFRCFNHGPVKLVFWGGATEFLTGTHLAAEIMFRLPDCVVCWADSFYIGRPVPVLSVDDELLPGHTYFVLPVDKLPCTHDPLTTATLASLSPGRRQATWLAAIGDSGGQCPFAFSKGGDGRPLIKVLPEFMAEVISSAAAEEDRLGSECRGALCSTPELRKHYAQLVGSTRGRPWSPKLETISESKKKLTGFICSLSPIV